jgi:hypothetical protein
MRWFLAVPSRRLTRRFEGNFGPWAPVPKPEIPEVVWLVADQCARHGVSVSRRPGMWLRCSTSLEAGNGSRRPNRGGFLKRNKTTQQWTLLIQTKISRAWSTRIYTFQVLTVLNISKQIICKCEIANNGLNVLSCLCFVHGYYVAVV